MQGGIAKQVINVDTEDGCQLRVKKDYPEAPGATWSLNNSCWAEFGEHLIYSSSHRTCFSQGYSFQMAYTLYHIYI